MKQVYQPLQDIYKMTIMSEKTQKINLWEIKYVHLILKFLQYVENRFFPSLKSIQETKHTSVNSLRRQPGDPFK